MIAINSAECIDILRPTVEASLAASGLASAVSRETRGAIAELLVSLNTRLTRMTSRARPDVERFV